MDTKNWWQSRTIVLNIVLVVLMALLAALEVLANAGAAVTGATLIAAAIAAVNVALRFVTSTAITINNNSGPIANVGEQFTGPAQIGVIAGRDATNVKDGAAQ